MTNKFFEPLKLGSIELPNRVVMSPMTRSRSSQPGDVPNKLMAEYYAQRASAGLIITEATQISRQGQGYSFTPGIYSAAQIEGWRKVTSAVHRASGRIFLQLWHVGRMSHPVFHNGELPVAPSACAFEGQVWVAGEDGVGRMIDCPTPRALTIAEIGAIVEDFRQGAANAVAAGFDGVEIHGANGYLVDQFLRAVSNKRTDEYGGSAEKRVRFLKEVTKAVANEIGAKRVGIRLAPFITARGMNDPEIIETILLTAEKLDEIGIAYIHLAEADWDDAPQIPDDFRHKLRKIYSGKIIVAGLYDKARGEEILARNLADLVAFGRAFIANPDLPDRLKNNLQLADYDEKTLMGGNAHGYTDYPG